MIRRVSPDLSNFISSDVFKTFAFNQLVIADKTVYIAGVPASVGDLAELRVEHPDNMKGQLKFVLDTFDELLATEGLDRTSIVSWTIYASVTHIPDLVEAMPEIVTPWVGDHAPASTVIAVPGWVIPGQVLEITAVAVIP